MASAQSTFLACEALKSKSANDVGVTETKVDFSKPFHGDAYHHHEMVYKIQHQINEGSSRAGSFAILISPLRCAHRS